MKTALILILMLTAAESPQSPSRLLYGDHTFRITEIPMLGLWHYEEGPPPAGKERAPEFDFEGFGNWSGYDATWLVRDSKLYLFKMTAKRDGKRIKNEQIFPEKTFPLHADWFTGRIHIAVGGYNQATRNSESVIVFEIEKGNIIKTSFHAHYEIPSQWNGIPSVEDDGE
jgi:hypothetical protein